MFGVVFSMLMILNVVVFWFLMCIGFIELINEIVGKFVVILCVSFR